MGCQGALNSFLDTSKCNLANIQNQLHLSLSALKCLCSLTCIPEENRTDQTSLSPEIKEQISELTVKFLLNITVKSQDEYQYCKVSDQFYY